jgi:hypothetical protein
MKHIRLGGGVVVAAFMIFMGLQKFIPGPNPIFSHLAAESGIELFEPVVRMLTGAAEFAAAALILAGLFLGLMRGLGALLSLGVIGGAIVFHLSPWLGINAPVAFAEDGGYVYSPMLFIMAVGFFAVSAVLTWIDREHLPVIGGAAGKPGASGDGA